MLKEELIVSLRVTLVTLVLTGLLYPLATTGVALLVFPQQARGSLLRDAGGAVLGSEWIGQGAPAGAEGAGYLAGRPSAVGFDAAGSGGSNLGGTSKALRERVAKELQRLIAENPEAAAPVPAALVSTSASGLDPHLPPEAALWQVPRIARARGVSAERVRAVIEAHVEGRDFLLLGEPRVNVLLTNLSLDRQFGRPPLAQGR